MVRDTHGKHFARVKIPDALPHLVALHACEGKDRCFVWLEDVIEANLADLFPGIEIVASYPFHVTRDAEYAVQEIESDDLLETIEEAVWRRRFRELVRLQVNCSMPDDLAEILTSNFELDPKDVFRVDGPLDLGHLKEILSLDRPDLKEKPFTPCIPAVLNDEVYSRRCGRRTSSSIIRSIRSNPWSNSSNRPPGIRKCWPSK